jgi:hopene-associated glycosyltransferase HpnB
VTVALAILLLVLWVYLWLARCRLAGASDFDAVDTQRLPERWPSVSVVIPARNEADILRFTLPSLLSLYYPQVQVLLVDDCSEDDTAGAALQAASARGAANFRVVPGAPPPSGWRGKLWALQQGVEASSGEWLLFTDADIYYNPNVLRDLVRMALSERYELASLMAVLRAESFWDRLLLPAFFFFFHLLYPFHHVRNGQAKAAAAAGGCVLVEREALLRAGGLQRIKNAWIDDLALARALKSSGARLYLGATVQVASFRRYGTLRALREMVVRSAFTQLHYSWVLVGLTLLGLGFLFGAPAGAALLVSIGKLPVQPAAWQYLADAAVGATLGFMMLAYLPAVRLYRLPLLWSLTLPVAALVYAAMTLESAVTHSFGSGPRWKGRSERENA